MSGAMKLLDSKSSDKPVQKCEITIEKGDANDPSNGEVQGVYKVIETNENGEFDIEIEPGYYYISAKSADGKYATSSKTGCWVYRNEITNVNDIVLEKKEYTAFDLIDKNLSEFVALMGSDYQVGSINILGRPFTIPDGSDSALMVYNETTMPGIAMEVPYSIKQEIGSGVNVRDKIQRGDYDYNSIVVYNNGKLNDTISANMTYTDLTPELGDFDCKGAGGERNYFFISETNNAKVYYYFDFYSIADFYQYTQNGIIPSANMRILNPKISRIEVIKK